MDHIEVREPGDDDRDGWYRELPDPAEAEAWLARQRAENDVVLRSVREGGALVGLAASFVSDSGREVSFWVGPDARERGVGAEILRLLVSLEPDRPLLARIPAADAASLSAATKLGFTELSRTTGGADEVLLALPPTLE